MCGETLQYSAQTGNQIAKKERRKKENKKRHGNKRSNYSN
jgi:hypothetical protein